MKKFLLIPLVALSLVLGGCNAAAVATRTQNIVAGVIAIAQADIPVLEQGGTISAADAPIVNAYLALGVSLDSQLAACNQNAISAGSKKAAFLGCFNAFSNGLLSPSELAQLRVLSPKAQNQTIIWVTAIALGVNVAFDAFGGTPIMTPVTVGTAPPPTTSDLELLAARINCGCYVTAIELPKDWRQ